VAKKQKYYVVWEGNSTWHIYFMGRMSKQIKGYPSAKYKSFENLAEAEFAKEIILNL
jgi:ribonuclease HI